MEQPETSGFRVVYTVLKHAATGYGRDFGSRMAAAISFRTVFALAPMLVIAVSIAGFVLGSNAEAQEAIVDNVTEIAGAQVAEFLSEFIAGALESADTAALIGVVVLLWSSSTLFLELQRALNQIFEVPIKVENRILYMVIQRGVGILWTIGAGLMLIALFAVNAATQVAGDAIATLTGLPVGSVGVLGFVISFAFMALTFGLVFETLTLDSLPWRPVWIGAVFTASAFSLAGYLTGIYFTRFGQPTALGFTGSIVILLFLAYLLSSVFLFGAEVTQSYRELVYETDRNRLLVTGAGTDSEHSESQPGAVAVSLTAVATFLIGLFVGRRK